MKARTLIIIGLIIAAGGAAFYYYERQLALLTKLTYKLIGFRLGDLSLSQSTADITIRIFSESTLDAQVSGVYIDVYISGKLLGSVTNDLPFIIPAKGYSDANFQIKFSPALLLSSAVSLAFGFQNSQDFPINLVGFVRIKEAFLSISVPFAVNTTLKQILSS